MWAAGKVPLILNSFLLVVASPIWNAIHTNLTVRLKHNVLKPICNLSFYEDLHFSLPFIFGLTGRVQFQQAQTHYLAAGAIDLASKILPHSKPG